MVENELNRFVTTTRRLVCRSLKNVFREIKETKLRTILNQCIKPEKAYNRAIFVRLGYQSCGKQNWNKTIDALLAVELLNWSVAIIDDIFDRTSIRGTESTIYKRFNSNIAIVAASLLKTIANEKILSVCKKVNLPKSKTLEILEIFEDAYRKMYVGQFLDLSYETLNFDAVTVNMYLKMIKFTTGFDVANCCKIGAVLGNMNASSVKILGNYGLNVGMIFQIRDDLIDYINDQRLIEKTPFSDFLNGKKRIPLLLAINKYASIKQKKKLLFLIKKQSITTADKVFIAEIITDKRIIQNIRKIIYSLRKKALKDICVLGNKKIVNIMKELISLGCDI